METSAQDLAVGAQEEQLQLVKKILELKELTKLDELKQLIHLDKLVKLEQLDQLQLIEQLSSLTNLQELKALENLDKLDHLDRLNKLDELEKLKQLELLKNLDSLKALDHLPELKNLESLKDLGQLSELSKLEQLNLLTKLEHLATLEKVLDKHQTTLAPLQKLEHLDQLNKLVELDKLNNLHELSSLHSLDKLKLLQDPKLQDNLNRLDQLDYLKKGVKYIAVQQATSFIIDILKLVLVALAIVFFLTRESGREIISKALPAIGLGSSAQVNLGLRLIVGESSPEEFEQILSDVKHRMKNELSIVFSPSPLTDLKTRLVSLENVKNYSFKYNDINLNEEARNLIKDHSNHFFGETISRLEYDAVIAKAKEDMTHHNLLREVKLLLAQEKYPTVLERSHSYWNKSESLRRAITYSAIKLSQDDPQALEEILKNLPIISGEIKR